MLCVPVIRNYNISGQMHVLCIRNLVTYAGTVVVLQVLSKWSLLKIRGLKAMGLYSLVSQATTAYSDLTVSYCQWQSLCTIIIGDERLRVN